MNVQDFTYLLQNPGEVVSSSQTKELEGILAEYPYFQAARAIHLKGLKNLNSFKYNNALKVTAAYTAERDMLFDFITSKEFLQNNIADSISGKKEPEIAIVSKKTVVETVKEEKEIKIEEIPLIETSADEPLPQNTEDADQILDPQLFKSKDPKIDQEIKEQNEAKQALSLGEPIPFTSSEKYSFSQWLQLAAKKPIQRESLIEKEEKEIEKDISTTPHKEEKSARKKKFERIDAFIANNPKIVPKENSAPKVNVKAFSKLDKNELTTETLAKVYLEQKKYKKALQAYRILSLKYPEKSGFFADRLKAIQKIQQENNK